MHQVKKVLKIILIVVVVLAALIGGGLFYMSRQPAAPDNYWTKIKTTAAIEAKYNAPGKHTVTSATYEAPDDIQDEDENFYQVWYPEDKGTYPLVVMVNGTGVPCTKYESVFEHIASWGYVVIGNNYGWNWDGFHASETLTFALETQEIASVIDTDKIAIGGHSQGGMGTFNAITMYDNGSLYKAAFSLSPTNEDLAISLDWKFALSAEEAYAYTIEDITIPMFLAAGTGHFDSETVSPLSSMQEEYKALSGDKVMCRRSDDTDHGAMLYETNGYVIAWLDYYLKDVSENVSAFYGDEAELKTNTRYQDVQSERDD